MTVSCPPGNHPVDFTYRVARWSVCSPDVPGSGLPWDVPTVVCALGVLTVLGSFAFYLAYLMWSDRKRSE